LTTPPERGIKSHLPGFAAIRDGHPNRETLVSAKTVQFALEKDASARGLPTARIALTGKPTLREIVAAQKQLLESLPKFKGFGLKACPNCHSGLERIVIEFGDPFKTRFSNVVTAPIREVQL